MNRFLAVGALTLVLGGPSVAQEGLPYRQPYATGTIVTQQSNVTGGAPDLVISRGATGADTVTTSSAAGGNANLPERAIPNGSGGGGNSGR